MLYRFDEKMLGWRSIKKAKCIWSSEVKHIIDNWISYKYVNGESKNIAIEFYKADKVLEHKQKNTSDVINNKSHSQAYHTSRLLDFTTKLNVKKKKTNY